MKLLIWSVFVVSIVGDEDIIGWHRRGWILALDEMRWKTVLQLVGIVIGFVHFYQRKAIKKAPNWIEFVMIYCVVDMIWEQKLLKEVKARLNGLTGAYLLTLSDTNTDGMI
eukprot:810293_1